MKLNIPGGIGMALLAAVAAGYALSGDVMDGRKLVLGINAEPIVGSCYGCIVCSSSRHEMKDDIPHQIFETFHVCADGGDHDCQDHNGCSAALPPSELGQLWIAIQTLEGPELKAIMSSYPQVEYNSRRGVFQVRQCGGLVAQVPLTAAQARTLAD
jgi:hypothetical protein